MTAAKNQPQETELEVACAAHRLRIIEDSNNVLNGVVKVILLDRPLISTDTGGLKASHSHTGVGHVVNETTVLFIIAGISFSCRISGGRKLKIMDFLNSTPTSSSLNASPILIAM